ncbi:MAG TPA: amidase [Xanthobacteraceae bacterium]|nr:amidase [Xanthobacteraceae bacterium]
MSVKFRSAFVPHDITAPITGAPTGPLAGLTAAVKDMYDITGEKAGGGSPDWLAAQTPARTHAGAVARILDAGATIVGKTVCDEFFYSVTGANAHYGTPVNPRAPGRLPGGSSSGSAAAVAAGTCDFALGSDTGGSVRIPAAFCGIYGIRPTHGRFDLAGAMAMAPSFDVGGWFASGPGLFRRLGDILLVGHKTPGTIGRVVVLDDSFAQADAEIRDLLLGFLAQAKDVYPQPVHGIIAPEGFEAWRDAFRIVQAHEVWHNYGAFVRAHQPKFGPGIRERMEFAATVSETDAAKAREICAGARDHIRQQVGTGTVLVLPTAPCIAPRCDTPANALDSFRTRVMRLTCVAGLGGLPQVSIPVGSVAGCPVGLSFIGWAGGDEALLDLAVSLAPYVGATSAEPI